MANAQDLPPKEQAQFKKILKYYETKQYKQGLKAAKYILSQPRFAEHGETLALKGLTLNCLNKKEEAYKLVKRGIANDMRSHVCWHVYGLLYRSDKDYSQAVKCYRKALHFDPENSQILRDLSLLQIQIRDLEGFRETRHTLWTLRPTIRVSWLAYAVAFQLLGKFEQASTVLMAWRNNPQNTDSKYEDSELLMYNATILREDGKFEEVLKFLDRHEAEIVDKLALTEMRGEMHLELGQKAEAEAIYRGLLDRNVECASYYEKLEQAVGLGPGSDSEARIALYHSFLSDRPRAHAPKRLPLFFIDGDLLRRHLDEYLRPNIRKGMTPVFRNIRRLYEDPAKGAIVGELAASYVTALRATPSKFDPKASDDESPTVLVFALSFYAQHLDRVGNLVQALEVIDEAIKHTPTILELYMVKAKILKHGGNTKQAAEVLDSARELDTADRFINSKCVKYMFRAGRIADAERTAGLFTRESADPIAQLTEMQCVWFETESARAYIQALNTGMALKKLHAIAGHFDTIVEDQFDFHSYCMRKLTLRAYVEMLRTEDKIRKHSNYFNASVIAVQIYLGLHDVPFGSKEREEQNALLAGMTPAERKKMLSKQKKAKAMAASNAASGGGGGKKKGKGKGKGKSSATSTATSAGANTSVNFDENPKADPTGEAYARVQNPLDQASKFLAPLLQLSPNRLETQFLAFEVAWRQKKALQMLRAVRRSMSIAPEDPASLRVAAIFLNFVDTAREELHPTVREVIELELSSIFGDKASSSGIHDKILAVNDSLPFLLVAAELHVLLTKSAEKAADLLLSIKALDALAGVDLRTCRRVIHFLKTRLGSDRSAPFQELCAKHFPLATWEEESAFIGF